MISEIKKEHNGSVQMPDTHIIARDVFNIDCDWEIPSFSERSELVPDVDPSYLFDHDTTISILAGFKFNKRVMVQGYHGTGKSTHIEQVAAHLNWPCVRINLDSHVSRIDLIGKDTIKLEDGKQVTAWQDGLLTWAIQNPCALIFDEYDAGRPDVMFVIQRILEAEGKLTLLDQNKIISAHSSFRLFATANTIGLGDTTGLYHGTHQLNQGQMDRWNIVTALNYLSFEQELQIMINRFTDFANTQKNKDTISSMIRLANLTRSGFINGDISTLMSPRAVMSWIDNTQIFNDRELAFKLSFSNKCDEAERDIICEYYQRCFDIEIDLDTCGITHE